MRIEALKDVHGSTISTDGLLSYLSQVVISQIDEKIEQKQRTIKTIKNDLIESKTRLNTIKDRMTHVASEQRRLVALDNVLQLINNLKREGVIIGSNRAKISKLLYKVQDQNMSSLVSLKQRLSTYLPEQTSRITIS